MNGAGIGGINQQNLKNILVPILPYNIQEEFTNKANNIKKQKKFIEYKIDEINEEKKKIIELAFNSAKQKKLDDVCKLITDGTHSTPEYSRTGIPFLSATNVVNKKIDWEHTRYVSNALHEKLWYLLEIINSERIRNEFLSKIIGMGVPNLHLNKIKEVDVPIIDYEEQKEFGSSAKIL